MLSGIESWSVFAQRKELITDGRMAMERMLREIRMIKDTTSILTAGAATFEFVDTNDNDIVFTFSAGAITRAENGTTNTLLGNVSSVTFTYYDTNNAAIASPVVSPSATNIRRAEILISMSKGESGIVNLKSDVRPRNL